MHYKIISFVGLVVLLAGCRIQRNTAASEDAGLEGTVTVFAAASLTDAFTDLGQAFEAANPGTAVVLNAAGSQQLAQQIVQGAPADVFASANQAQMAVAVGSGRIAPEAPQPFARNRLVVVFPADNPAAIQHLPDLTRPDLDLILAASEVPVGQYTLDFLDKAAADGRFGSDFKTAVLANVVSYEQNVRAVLTKVALGEADAGIVYASDVAGRETENVGRLDIPDALNTPALYPIAPLVDSQNQALAEAFIDFVLSARGQEILSTYGFIPFEGR